jgi:ABC-type Mn2+/Zn2+ transport system ATPase subunit
MALSHSPTTLLLDEPFTGLDSEGIEIISKLLQRAKMNDCSILIVTHDEVTYADRVVELFRGEIK